MLKPEHRSYWKLLCGLLDQMPENTQIVAPGATLADIWSRCQKTFKSELLEPILSTSGLNGRRCSNRNSWNPLCWLLDSITKCSNRSPWKPVCRPQKMLKWELFEPILSTCGAKARIISPEAFQIFKNYNKPRKQNMLRFPNQFNTVKTAECNIKMHRFWESWVITMIQKL